VDGLHGALAEGRLADERAPLRVLHGAGHDLGGARGAPVDQDHQRHLVDRVALCAVGPAWLVAFGDVDDRPLVDEHAGDVDRLVEQPTGVATQVQHDARGSVRDQLVDGLADLLPHAGGELAQPHVAAAVVEPLAFQVRQLDALAGHRELPGALGSPLDADGDVGPLLALDLLDDHVDRPPLDRLALHADDPLALLHARAGRGRVLEHRDDHQPPGRLLQHDTDAGEPPVEHGVEVVEGGLVVVARVRVVQDLQQPLDRPLDQRLAVGCANRVAIQGGDDLLEEPQLAAGSSTARDDDVGRFAGSTVLVGGGRHSGEQHQPAQDRGQTREHGSSLPRRRPYPTPARRKA
jgi:hypothetical protein